MRLVASKLPVVLAFLVFLAGLPASEEPAAGRFAWSATYAEALQRAAAGKCPVLVYFPPVRGRDPRVLQLAPKALGSPPAAQGLRVGPDEVKELATRYLVRSVPAVLLLDRCGNVIHRWDGAIPSNFWKRLRGFLDRATRAEQAIRRKLEEARRIAQKGELEGAYRMVAPLLDSCSTPPDLLDGARQIEGRLVRSVRGQMLRVLAAEGIDDDRSILDRLRKLRAATAHPGLRREIEKQMDLLMRTTIGGRR